MTASVAGYPPGYVVAYTIAMWQSNGFGYSLILYVQYTFTVGSDGTGSRSASFANQAGRTDLLTDIYVDGVQKLYGLVVC